MRLDKDKIRDIFALFTDLPDSELSNWSMLCENAGTQISNRLRENVSVSREMERLCTAAAAIAYCDYTMFTSGSSSDTVRVGDISLGPSGKSSDELDAVNIRDHFLSQIADLIVAPLCFAATSAECKL